MRSDQPLGGTIARAYEFGFRLECMAGFVGIRRSTKRFFKDIEIETGLQLPRRAPSWIGTLAADGLLGGLLGVMAVGAPSAIGLHFWKWAWAPAAMIAFAPVLWSLDPGEFPENCETLGDLARRVSRLNFGGFAKAGARVNRTELWDALTELVSPYSSLPIAQMCPEALLLEGQRDAA